MLYIIPEDQGFVKGVEKKGAFFVFFYKK